VCVLVYTHTLVWIPSMITHTSTHTHTYHTHTHTHTHTHQAG